MANVTANICNVNGIGPIGTVIHAETAMIAIESAPNEIERVREEVFPSAFSIPVLSVVFEKRSERRARVRAKRLRA